MSSGCAQERLHYVDLIRVLTIALVIGTHVLALSPVVATTATGALTILFHVSREVFFLLTAFVLTYGTTRRKPRWPAFWRKRFLFVAVPYVAWTVLYFLADGAPFQSDLFVQQLLTGSARYHLYFLLVSMQIYLVFPVIRALLRVTQRHHGWLLAGCAAFQLLFSLYVKQGWPGGILTGWLRFPDAMLPSYLGYILAGAIAGWHREELVAWTRVHHRGVLTGSVTALAAGLGVYFGQVFFAGQPPLVAAFVWQPAVVVESVAVAWAFLALGLRWQDRGMPGRALVLSTSDASFGVYLVHPLILQGILLGAGAIGLVDYAQTVPNALVMISLVVLLLPPTYLVSVLLTVAARRTPVSLALTGRARRHPPVSAPRREELALATPGGMR